MTARASWNRSGATRGQFAACIAGHHAIPPAPSVASYGFDEKGGNLAKPLEPVILGEGGKAADRLE